jgi:uncharacterized zinc-type alcohol dehydrogenase-like protein
LAILSAWAASSIHAAPAPIAAAGLEQFCAGMVMTYGSMDKHLNAPTLGGYAQSIVVTEDFVLRMPANLNLAAAAPLLCAGITTYSPMRHWKVGPGQKVGIVGLGGLGHMAVKFAKAFGAQVVLFTTSPGKVADAKRLGAHEVVVSTDEAQMAAQANSFDFILDAVSATHDLNAYLNLLKRDGNLVLVGAPDKPLPVAAFPADFPSPFLLRFIDRRIARDAGDAGFLRKAQHHERY